MATGRIDVYEIGNHDREERGYRVTLDNKSREGKPAGTGLYYHCSGCHHNVEEADMVFVPELNLRVCPTCAPTCIPRIVDQGTTLPDEKGKVL